MTEHNFNYTPLALQLLRKKRLLEATSTSIAVGLCCYVWTSRWEYLGCLLVNCDHYLRLIKVHMHHLSSACDPIVCYVSFAFC